MGEKAVAKKKVGKRTMPNRVMYTFIINIPGAFFPISGIVPNLTQRGQLEIQQRVV